MEGSSVRGEGAKEVVVVIPNTTEETSNTMSSSHQNEDSNHFSFPKKEPNQFSRFEAGSYSSGSPNAESTEVMKPKPRVPTAPPSARRSSLPETNNSRNDSPARVRAYAKADPLTLKTPLMVWRGRDEDDEDDYDDMVYTTANLHQHPRKGGKKVEFFILIEWVAFISTMGVLIASLTIHKMRNLLLWSLEIWKWCVLALVIFCGRLVTEWCCNILVFSTERNFLLKKKVLYFVYGLKGSVRVFFWLGLILLAWSLLISRGVQRSTETTHILYHITRALACTLIGSAMWVLKTLFIKILASSFHVKTFFDRIQESIFHQYVLRALSGPLLVDYPEKKGGNYWVSGQLRFNNPSTKGKKPKDNEVINVDKLYKMKREKVSAWTMGGLTNVIATSGLSTIADALDESVGDEGDRQKEITSELQAESAAQNIFRNVAKPGNTFIEKEDLWRFLTAEEVNSVLPMFKGSQDTGKISKSQLVNWVVRIYNERKVLANSLNDTKTAIEELNKIASGIVIVLIIIVWLLLAGIETTNVLVFISSQLLLVTFVFGNTAKTVFEAIVFVFVVHPFDVGDRCVIDGAKMVVEEMNILTTIFRRSDREKIYYPNAVLSTKPISNYNRILDLSDTLDFDVSVSVPNETIDDVKGKQKNFQDAICCTKE